MILRALILGKGAPNRCRDGTASMCAIALTRELGLIRIYPLHVQQKEIRVWSVCDLECEINNKDCRRESWKLLSARVVGSVDDRTDRAAILDACILNPAFGDPVNHQNANCASIAVVSATVTAQIVARGHFSDGPADDQSADSWIMCQKEFAHKPMIRWRTANGGEHESHVVAQEVYEFIRLNPLDPARVFSNLQLTNPDHHHWLVVGNMRDRRNVWVVVHVHRMKKPVIASAGNYFATPSPDNTDWPYWSHQAATIRCTEEPQLSLPFDTEFQKAC